MRVSWNENACAHSGSCVKSPSPAFRAEDGKFIVDENANEASVRETAAACLL